MTRIAPKPGPRCPEVVRMVSPIHYPGDYGFVPGAIAEDNDPLDVLALVTSPSFPGCLHYVRPVGVLDMVDGEEPHHTILAVPAGDPLGAAAAG